MRFQPDSTIQPTPHAPLNAQVQRCGANVYPRRPAGKAAATTLVCMGRPQKRGWRRGIGFSRCGTGLRGHKLFHEASCQQQLLHASYHLEILRGCQESIVVNRVPRIRDRVMSQGL
jgi:hypothetical protein